MLPSQVSARTWRGDGGEDEDGDEDGDEDEDEDKDELTQRRAPCPTDDRDDRAWRWREAQGHGPLG